MKRQTRLSLVKIVFICFSVCNIVVPAPLKNPSRLLRIPKKKFSQTLRNARQTTTDCNKKDWLTDLDKPTYSKMDLIISTSNLLQLIFSVLTVATAYNMLKITLQMRQNHDNSEIS